MRNVLQRKANPLRINNHLDKKYQLCGSENETIQHLFQIFYKLYGILGKRR